MIRAEFRSDFDLSSIDVRVESGTFCGCGTVVLYDDNVRRLREFVSALGTYPLQPSAVEISEPGSVILAASQHDRVGHLVLSVQVSDGGCMARIAIPTNYSDLQLFSRQLAEMLEGKLAAFDLVSSTT